jgi:hypothetical protein
LLTHRGAETPLDLSVAVSDSEIDPGDPAQIALVLENRADGKMRIDGAPPPPFGVLRIRRVSDERPLVLWTDRYIEAGGPDGRAGIIIEGKWAKDIANDMGASIYIDPHETGVLLYTLHATTRNLAAGTYTTALLKDLDVDVRDPEADEDYTSHGEPNYRLRVQISKR